MHPIETPDKTFHDGDGVSELGTILPAWWLNQVQSELLAVLTAVGIQPDKSQPNQLLAALNKLAVVTTGNQEIDGDKTFTGLITLKKGAIVADSVGDFNANQYLQIGANNVNAYFYNKRSGKYLSMRNDGELRYDGKRLLNVDDLAGMIPSGAVMYFAGQTAPTGWLKANGAAVPSTPPFFNPSVPPTAQATDAPPSICPTCAANLYAAGTTAAASTAGGHWAAGKATPFVISRAN